MDDARAMLRRQGLRDTLPRRAVLRAFRASERPLSVADVRRRLRRERQSVGIVTVYRIIAAFLRVGLLHEHAREGAFSLCRQPDVAGHHVLLRCESCGRTGETHDQALCHREEQIAKRLGFRPVRHVSELLGLCSSCA